MADDQLLEDLMLGLEQDMAHIDNKEYYGACVGCKNAVFKGDDKCMVESRLYHDKCFKCAKCSTEIGKSPYHLVKEEPHCKNCYLDEVADKCDVCNSHITDSKISFGDKTLHAKCFKCTGCDKVLDGVAFKQMPETGELHCVPCYQDKTAKTCEGCNQKIIPTGPNFTCVLYENMRWHNECFKCNKCDVVCNSETKPGHINSAKKTVSCLDHCGCNRCISTNA